MEAEEIIKKLKILTSGGVRITAIESKIGLPKNNLSGVLNGKKRFPEKWKPKLEFFLNDLTNPTTFPYLISEQELQLIKMDSLGVPINSGATFEQLVNTVIFMAGDYKGKWQEAIKNNGEGMIPPHPKREDFDDPLDFAMAKNDWKKKYNL